MKFNIIRAVFLLSLTNIVFISPSKAEALDESVIHSHIECGQDINSLMDDFVNKIGVIPSTLNDKVISYVNNKIKSTAKVVHDFSELCMAAQSKNGIEAYFYVLDKLTSGAPASAYYSQQINAGRKIVEQAHAIANNLAFSGLYNNLGLATDITLTISKEKSSLFNWFPEKYSAYEANSLLAAMRLVVKTKDNNMMATQPLWKCSDDLCSSKTNGVKILRTSVGESLSNLTDGDSIKELYIELTWNNGQVSLIPIRNNFLETTAYGFNLNFAQNKGFFEYVY